MSQGDWSAIMRGEDRSLRGELWRSLLVCAEPSYRTVVSLRNALYDRGIWPAHSLGRTTISVGNITAGGTGKTPMTIELARRLLASGAHPAVLLRGHMAGASRESGRAAASGVSEVPNKNLISDSDEARLLMDELGSRVVVHADPNRVNAAQQVLKQSPEVDVFLLDDGFQHRRVQRDLDIVLIDATDPFGLGRMLPRGLLREPREALGRAGAVLVTRADQVDGDELRWIDAEVAKITGRGPLAHMAHRWIGFRDDLDKPFPLTHLQRAPTLGVCAIGNPRAFASTLAHHTGVKLPLEVLPDHHRYTARELEAIFAKGKAAGAEVVVTTEKDWVKWKPLLTEKPSLPVYRPVLRLMFMDGEAAVDGLLRHVMEGARGRGNAI